MTTMHPSMVLAYRAPTGLDAHVVRAALEQAGIPAEVRNEMLAPLAGGLPYTDVMVEVWIPGAHVGAARAVLETLQRPVEGAGHLSLSEAPPDAAGALSEAPGAGALSPAERPCPACGEPVPRELSECWNCQTSLV